jgi:hypothetical protein
MNVLKIGNLYICKFLKPKENAHIVLCSKTILNSFINESIVHNFTIKDYIHYISKDINYFKDIDYEEYFNNEAFCLNFVSKSYYDYITMKNGHDRNYYL